MCLQCRDWHLHALQVLSGETPKGCQECGVTTEQLRHASHDFTVSLYVVPANGIYAVLCEPCKLRFSIGMRGLFKGTPYGARLN